MIDSNLQHMQIEHYKSINWRIYNSIRNPKLQHTEVERMLHSDAALVYKPTCFCIINPRNLEVLHLSKNFQECLGISDYDFKMGGLSYLWNLINVEDLRTLTSTLEDLLYFIQNEIFEVNNIQLSYSWNYRIKTFDNKEINIIQHTTPFTCTRKNENRSLKYFTVIRGNQKLPITASINSLDNYQQFRTLFSTNCSQSNFFKEISNRERDIIRLLNENMSSKDISEQLFISRNTVDTHRRNILKKLKLSSTGELKAIVKNSHFTF